MRFSPRKDPSVFIDYEICELQRQRAGDELALFAHGDCGHVGDLPGQLPPMKSVSVDRSLTRIASYPSCRSNPETIGLFRLLSIHQYMDLGP